MQDNTNVKQTIIDNRVGVDLENDGLGGLRISRENKVTGMIESVWMDEKTFAKVVKFVKENTEGNE